jgi:hypothetical protein
MTVQLQTYRPTLNAGQVYLRLAMAAAPLQAIGNVSVLQLAISEDEKTLADYTAPGGGQWAALSRVTGIEASMTLHDLDPVNLARAIYGDATATVAGSETTQPHVAYQGGLTRLAHPAPTSVVVAHGAGTPATSHAYLVGDWVYTGTHVYQCTTAGTSAATAPTWKTDGTDTTDGTVVWADRGAFATVADTDYEVRREGLLILEGGIPDGCPIKVSYSYGAYSAVEALTAGGQIYELSFGGLNEANNNSPVVLDIFRLKISAASALDFLGDDFASLEVKGKVLLDPTKSGAGTSKYFRVQMA